MKAFLCLVIIVTAIGLSSAHAKKLTLERIYSSPSLNGEIPKKIKFSPNGKFITYLKPKSTDKADLELWHFNIASEQHKHLIDAATLVQGSENLSDEEKARRERQRISTSGIFEYEISPQNNAITFPLAGNIFIYYLQTQSIEQLTNSKSFDTDIKFSPKGNYISFIREKNIFIYSLKSGKENKLTKDKISTIKNGMAEFIAQEEMGRMTGYWWAPNEKNIAFLQVDESPVEVAIRNEIYADSIKLVEQRYPYTGSNNVITNIALINISNNKITRIHNTQDSKDYYIPRLSWLPNSEAIIYQWQSRDQKTLKLLRYRLKNKKITTLLTEKSTHWLNLHDDLYFLKTNNSFIWSSERDGFKHLYHFNQNGKLINQLTKGLWVIDKLEYVDEDTGWVYFSGRADSPLEKHLYKVSLNSITPEHVERVSSQNGYHNIIFAKKRAVFADFFSNTKSPHKVDIHDLANHKKYTLSSNTVDKIHPLNDYKTDIITPTFGSIIADDGVTKLFYKIFQPKHLIQGKKYPVIVKVYGGPGVQRVKNQWQKVDLTQYLAQQGYIVFQLDSRGSSNRGAEFEKPIHNLLGKVELVDQVSGVKYLHSLPHIDKSKIAIYGHSYGGYISLMAMMKKDEYFSAGISGAPVTDWRLYDTHYTERYLGKPNKNSQGYENSSVFPYIQNLKKPLLIYHGMADDNVLFTHTTKLIKTLQDENKHFSLMTYPGSKHSLNGKKVKMHLASTIVKFLEEALNTSND